MKFHVVQITFDSCDTTNVCYFYPPKMDHKVVDKRYTSITDAYCFFQRLRQHIKTDGKYDNFTNIGEKEFLAYITGSPIDMMITVRLYEEDIDVCNPNEDSCIDIDKFLNEHW